MILGILVLAMLAHGLVGLHAGYSEKRNMIAWVTFVFIISVVFLLILDLSRGQSGVFTVSNQAMFDLQRQLSMTP
jgi:hypothetical protein